MESNNNSNMKKRIDPATTIYPFAAILALCLFFIIDPEGSTNALSVIRGFLGNEMGTYYLAVGLGVLVSRKDKKILQAGGFIIQLMPFAEEETISALEKNLKGIDPVTKMLSDGYTPEQMLEKVLEGMNLEVTEKTPVAFRCNCGKERYERALVLLGRDEVQKIDDEGEPVEITCQFCGKKYSFSPEELQTVLKKTEKKS